MYVYLDTGQVSQFASLSATGLSTDELTKKWNQKNLTLCLSLKHLQEIASLADEKSRKNRILVLDKIDRLCCAELGWPSIIQNEIVVALVNSVKPEKQGKISLQKEAIWKHTGAPFLLDYIETNIGLLRKAKKLHEAECSMQEHYRTIRREAKRHKVKIANRVKDLGQNTKDTVQSVVNFMRSAEGVREIPIIEKSIAELEKSGSLEKYLGLETVPGIKRRDLADLDSLSAYFKLGRESIPYVSKMTGLAEDVISRHLQKISPEECPGFSLRMALLRAVKYAEKKYTPSDWADAAHLVYAPYVDRFYADKRTHDFLEKETRRQPFPLAISLISNIRRIVSLEKVIMEISCPRQI